MERKIELHTFFIRMNTSYVTLEVLAPRKAFTASVNFTPIGTRRLSNTGLSEMGPVVSILSSSSGA
jgi:hypothetical protein